MLETRTFRADARHAVITPIAGRRSRSRPPPWPSWRLGIQRSTSTAKPRSWSALPKVALSTAFGSISTPAKPGPASKIGDATSLSETGGLPRPESNSMSARQFASADPQSCGPLDFSAQPTLAAMVDHFLAVRGDRPARDRAWWGDPGLTLEAACRRAMFALEQDGVRDHHHQRPYNHETLHAMGARLVRHASEAWEKLDFEALYHVIERALEVRHAPLLVYDVTYRLGQRFETEPERVYLHAGPKGRRGSAQAWPGGGAASCA
jgi:hypothetical protein